MKRLVKRYQRATKDLQTFGKNTVRPLAKAAAAIATEPFTGAILKRHNAAIDKRNANMEAIAEERKKSLADRYPTIKRK